MVNKEYKDSVFSLLFSNPETLRELYGAIEGISVDPEAEISINTLSTVLYKQKYNDISFTIDNKVVVLIEQQSTINPNMPLRLLMYIARIYEKITNRKPLYHSDMVKIPQPEFIILYNGKTPYPARQTLKFSDAFIDLSGSSLKTGSGFELELIARVYNINKGQNEIMLKRCKNLNGYSTFIEKIREYEKDRPKEEAFESAIDYCIKNNILSQFLLEHSSEVKNMLLEEWNLDEALVVEREEGREEGREEAVKKLLKFGAMSPEQISQALCVPLETVVQYQGEL